MQRYVFRNGDWRDPSTDAPMPIPKRNGLCVPMVIKDVEPHVFRGHYIGSRQAQRDLAKREGFVPFEPVGEAATMPKAEFNKRDDNWQAWLSETKDKVAKRAGLDAKTVETEMAARKAAGSLRERVKRGEKRAPVEDTPRMRETREFVAKMAAKKKAT